MNDENFRFLLEVPLLRMGSSLKDFVFFGPPFFFPFFKVCSFALVLVLPTGCEFINQKPVKYMSVNWL